MSKTIVIPDNFATGYIYVGNAYGKFDAQDGSKRDFFNMFVLSPASDFQSADFHAGGFKCEKFKCASADVWKDLQVGDHVQVFFDAKGRAIGAPLMK